MENRKANELAHGVRIASCAEDVWGWGSAAGRRRARRRGDVLIEHGRVREGSTILELGCGTGVFSRRFEETGATVIALDLSWDLLTQIDIVKRETLYPILGDAESLPFASDSFDAVVGSSVLHHVDARRAALETLRVLRAGGHFAFAEPNMLNPQIALQKNIPLIKHMLGDSPDEGAFIRWRIAALMESAGFVDVKVFPYDFLHPLVPETFITLVEKIGCFCERIPCVKEIAGSLVISGCKP